MLCLLSHGRPSLRRMAFATLSALHCFRCCRCSVYSSPDTTCSAGSLSLRHTERHSAAGSPRRLPAGDRVLSALEDLHVSDFWLHTPHRDLLHDVKPLLLMLRSPLLLLRLHSFLWLRHLRRVRDAMMTAQPLIYPQSAADGLHLGFP